MRDATAAQLAPEFEAITQALREASTTLAKRDWVSEVKRSGKCSHDCLLSKIQLLVWEIAFTLKFVIVKLGLGESPNPLPHTHTHTHPSGLLGRASC